MAASGVLHLTSACNAQQQERRKQQRRAAKTEFMTREAAALKSMSQSFANMEVMLRITSCRLDGSAKKLGGLETDVGSLETDVGSLVHQCVRAPWDGTGTACRHA